MSIRRLADLLIEQELISPQQLRAARREQLASGDDIGSALVKLGFVGDREILQLLRDELRVPVTDLTEHDIDREAIDLIPRDAATRHRVIPLSFDGSSLILAMADPTDPYARDDVFFLTGHEPRPVAAPGAAILAAIEQHYDPPAPARAGAARRAVEGDEELVSIVDLEKRGKRGGTRR